MVRSNPAADMAISESIVHGRGVHGAKNKLVRGIRKYFSGRKEIRQTEEYQGIEASYDNRGSTVGFSGR